VIFADLVNFEQLVPFASFGLFALAAWWVLDFLAANKSRTVERLDELKNPALRRRSDEPKTVRKTDRMTQMLQKASPAFAKPLQPKSQEDVSNLKAKLANGGFRGDAAASIFLGMKFALLIGGFFFTGGGLLLASGVSQQTLVYTIGAAGLGFYLPDLVLALKSRKRKEAIFLGLPDALDLMVVCVESGLGLDQAMRKVSEEMYRTCRVLAEEFSLANFQLQIGQARATVLHELGVRTGVDDLRSLAAILIQADKFGSSIAQALRVQSDSMRTRRRQLAEERAAKTAVKLIFPLVIFIFPGIFVVLVGPAAITMAREMFPRMSGG